MRIANIMLGRERGGLEQAAINYACALNNYEHSVLNVVAKGSWAAAGLKRLNLPVTEIYYPDAWNLMARLKMLRLIQKQDIVFIHGNRAGIFIPAETKAKIVAVAHSRFFKNKDKFGAIIALTPAAAEHFKTRFPQQNIHYIPNGIVMPKYYKNKKTTWHNPPVIGAMGRHEHEKGVDIFIDALEILKRQGIDFRAVIAGDGTLSHYLKLAVNKKGLSDKISFPGWVSDKESFFKNIDVYCQPSREESFGLVLLEAMSHAIPCVATNCIGPNSIVENGKNGFLCEKNAQDMARALADVISNTQAADNMGLNARLKVAKNYSLETMAKSLHEKFLNEQHPKI